MPGVACSVAVAPSRLRVGVQFLATFLVAFFVTYSVNGMDLFLLLRAYRFSDVDALAHMSCAKIRRRCAACCGLLVALHPACQHSRSSPRAVDTVPQDTADLG